MKIDFRKYSCLPLMRPTPSVLKKWSCNYSMKIDFRKYNSLSLKRSLFWKSGFVRGIASYECDNWVVFYRQAGLSSFWKFKCLGFHKMYEDQRKYNNIKGIFLKCGVKIYDSHADCRRLGRHVLEIGLTWMYC